MKIRQTTVKNSAIAPRAGMRQRRSRDAESFHASRNWMRQIPFSNLLVVEVEGSQRENLVAQTITGRIRPLPSGPKERKRFITSKPPFDLELLRCTVSQGNNLQGVADNLASWGWSIRRTTSESCLHGLQAARCNLRRLAGRAKEHSVLTNRRPFAHHALLQPNPQKVRVAFP